MFKRKASVLMISCFIVLSLLLAACGGGGNDTKATSSNNTGGNDEAKSKEIVVAESSITNILDSAKANFAITNGICEHIFDRLVKFDEKLNVLPSIAESWERVDELIWEFTIKEGVKFQNGDDLKLSDIVIPWKESGKYLR